MVTAPATFDWPLLRQLQGEGLLSIVPHPEHSLYLLNYTAHAQYSNAFDQYPMLLSCRGTIVNTVGDVVARGTRKFWNVGERPGFDAESLARLGEPEVSHKLDGSFVLLYRPTPLSAPCFSTRGSFTSAQAQMAARIWEGLGYDRANPLLDRGCSYVFELVSPRNRIVVLYPDDDLILTGVIDTATGYEYSYREVELEAGRLGLRCVPIEHDLDWTTLHQMERDNFEGFVVFWPRAQVRAKIKLAEYVRLHRITTGLSESSVWELLRDGKPLEELRASIPEELHAWFDTTAGDLTTRYQGLASLVGVFLEGIERVGLNPTDRADRKKIAQQVLTLSPELRAPIFAALDGKDWQSTIWKMLEPSKETLFQKQGRIEEVEG